MKNLNILLLIAVLAFIQNSVFAASKLPYEVDVEVPYGLNHDTALKAKVEHNTAALITALNMAADLGKGLNYKDINISPEAKANLNNLWTQQKISYASFDDDFNTPISEKVVINRYGEYEIRNIPMIFCDNDNPDNSHYEEIGITFDKHGMIVNVYVTIPREQFSKLLKGMTEVKDENNRLSVLNMMESMSTAYHEKNIEWFKTFFSDDVLIVSGNRRMTPSGETFIYIDNDKTEYLKKLKNIFAKNKSIEVKFSDMTVMGHALDEKGRYYAVECIQDWHSTTYSDKGRLFVIWDFGDPKVPQLLYRAWTEPDDPRKFDIYEVKLNLE